MKCLNDVDYKNCVGKIYKSTNSGEFIVRKYNNRLEVEIEFLETGYRDICQMGNIRKGTVKDYYIPSAHGVGITGKKYTPTYKDQFGKRKTRAEYSIWNDMLRRCYSQKRIVKQPTYKGCTVSENFKHYEYFYEWCNNQIGFGKECWELDKDLLVKGNKLYSEDVCVFLPKELNLLLIKSNRLRGETPIGVSYHKVSEVFSAQMNRREEGTLHIGYYKTPEEAFYAYKEAKEAFIKEQTLKWKDEIDPRAYKALMSYQVDIDD